MVNLPRRHDTKCICTKKQNCKICEANADRNEGEIDKCTVIVGDVITLSPMNNTITRQKTIKDMEELNNTNKPEDLVDTYIMLQSTTAEYTFSSSAQKPYVNIDYILGHKTNLKNFKELKSNMFSDHKGIN